MHIKITTHKTDSVLLICVSVSGYAFWLLNTLKQQQWRKKKKKTWTNQSLFVCSNMTSYLCHHHPGVVSTRAQVKPKQHTLVSVFKLNSFKPCQFKHLRSRRHEWELKRTVRRSVCSSEARKPASQIAHKYWALFQVLFEWTKSHKNYVNMPVLSILADSQLNVSVHCLKVTALFNVNQTPKDKEIAHCSWLKSFCNFNKD